MPIDELTVHIRALLNRPDPPNADADPSDVLHDASAFLDARTPTFEQVRTAVAAGQVADAECRALLDQLGVRDRGWAAAIARAHHLASERVAGARRLRARR